MDHGHLPLARADARRDTVAMQRCLLVLGGTAEARALADRLVDAGLPVVSSLAGRVAKPRLPAGEVRIGGFGGPEALARWLVEHDAAAVIDATHPFAERISASAVRACYEARVPLVRLERPGWRQRADDRWHWVETLDDAASTVETLGSRVLLTTGRQGLAVFSSVTKAWFLVRCVDPPDPPLPHRCEVVLDRGPYTLEGELALIDAHCIDLVVTKDSGGQLTRAKLDAARAREIPVIVVRRPARPSIDAVEDVAGALRWLESVRQPG